MKRTHLLIIKAVFACFFFSLDLNAQNYRQYYQKVDSAFYYAGVENYKRSDSLFDVVFKNYNGFPDDYLVAIKSCYKAKGIFNYDYIAAGFRNGLTLAESRQYFRKWKIKVNKIRVRKLFRQNHCDHKIDVTPLKKIFIKDQSARGAKKGVNITSTDSSNFKELIRLYNEKPDLFNRKFIGDEWQQKLEVMLLHQRWKTVAPYFNVLISWVEKGFVERDFIEGIIERNSVLGGYLFKIKQNRREIEAFPNENLMICDALFCSLLGSFSFYHKEPEEKKGHQYLVPLNPGYSNEMINALREFVFLPSLELSYKMNTRKIKLDASDFCKTLVTKKKK